jgi:hypothetical protein
MKNSPWPTMSLWEKGLNLPRGATMFLGEQMQLKFFVIVTFSYESKLKCFQLQSCNFPWNLFNDNHKHI